MIQFDQYFSMGLKPPTSFYIKIWNHPIWNNHLYMVVWGCLGMGYMIVSSRVCHFWTGVCIGSPILTWQPVRCNALNSFQRPCVGRWFCWWVTEVHKRWILRGIYDDLMDLMVTSCPRDTNQHILGGFLFFKDVVFCQGHPWNLQQEKQTRNTLLKHKKKIKWSEVFLATWSHKQEILEHPLMASLLW